jgi:hypothetical protein
LGAKLGAAALAAAWNAAVFAMIVVESGGAPLLVRSSFRLSAGRCTLGSLLGPLEASKEKGEGNRRALQQPKYLRYKRLLRLLCEPYLPQATPQVPALQAAQHRPVERKSKKSKKPEVAWYSLEVKMPTGADSPQAGLSEEEAPPEKRKLWGVLAEEIFEANLLSAGRGGKWCWSVLHGDGFGPYGPGVQACWTAVRSAQIRISGSPAKVDGGDMRNAAAAARTAELGLAQDGWVLVAPRTWYWSLADDTWKNVDGVVMRQEDEQKFLWDLEVNFRQVYRGEAPLLDKRTLCKARMAELVDLRAALRSGEAEGGSPPRSPPRKRARNVRAGSCPPDALPAVFEDVQGFLVSHVVGTKLVQDVCTWTVLRRLP